jgi:hypothetical protein
MASTRGKKIVQALSHSVLRCQEVEARIGEQLAHPYVRLEGGVEAMLQSLRQQIPADFLAATSTQISLLVLIWIKAFIPINVPGYTQPAPGWGGVTMINDPWVPGCWLTDNRMFSNDAAASARMTSMLAVTAVDLTVNQLQYCDLTIRISLQ